VAGELIAVGVDAIDVMRRVGPTAWTVLTALALDAERSDGELIALASVRSLAAELGLNTDTVARAIVRLRRARLLVQVTGRFELGAYGLTIPTDVIGFTVTAPVERIRRHRQLPALSGTQLALLEAD
jgi:hypothetical protein